MTNVDSDNIVGADIIKEDEEIELNLADKYQKILATKEQLQVNFKNSKIDIFMQSFVKIMNQSEGILEEQVLFTLYDAGSNFLAKNPQTNIEMLITGGTSTLNENLLKSENTASEQNEFGRKLTRTRSVKSGNSLKIPLLRVSKTIKEMGKTSFFDGNIRIFLFIWKIVFALMIIFSGLSIGKAVHSFKTVDKVGAFHVLIIIQAAYLLINGIFGIYNTLINKKKYVPLQIVCGIGFILVLFLFISFWIKVSKKENIDENGMKIAFYFVMSLCLVNQILSFILNIKINQFFIAFALKVFKESVITGVTSSEFH